MRDASSRAGRRAGAEDESTRERILHAALDCISRTSARDLSVRAIAAQAEVNVATVHYYFGTKEGILSEALGLFFAPLLAELGALMEEPGSASERLGAFLSYYVRQFRSHPGIFTSIVEGMIASNVRKEGPETAVYERVLLGLLGELKPRLLSLVGEVSGLEEGRLRALRTMQVMASVVHPMLVSGLPLSLFGIDFAEEENRRDYVELLVGGLSAGKGARAR